MFFPYNTDAPIYYFPYTTIAMIAVNVVAFVLTVLHPEGAETFALAYGEGLRPWQWVTSNFLHGGLFHLIGNMMAVWTFGLIVEGKIGWWRMLAVYLGIGVFQCAIEQTVMLGASEGGSLGASAIAYGLMAISLVWAPKNDVNCVFVFLIFFYPIVFYFDVSVMMLVGVLLGLEIWGSILSGLEMTSMLLHSMGGVLGAAVGIWMLRTERVDCENWDAFSVWAGKHEMTPDELLALEEKDPQVQARKREEQLESRKAALRNIRRLVAAGRPQEAHAIYRRKAQCLENWGLPEDDLRKMIVAFHKLGQWTDSIPAMAEYVRAFPERAAAVRLKLAQILVQKQQRPAQAWNVFSKIDPEGLDAPQKQFHARLRQVILRAKEQHPYDHVEADW